ncbi:MAG: zinc-dependent metalloprotease [Bacteroidota bacterium]
MTSQKLIFTLFLLPYFTLLKASATASFDPLPSISKYTENMDKRPGFFTTYWDAESGRILIEISQWEEDFLYINSLTAGLGSNDIGLDRNQLGGNRVVRFEHSGPRVLLIERNLNYRATSDNEAERMAVQEAFAESVLYGTKALAATEDALLIDLTGLLFQDIHGVSQRLKSRGQGTYKVDTKRSAVYLDRTRNFPDNSEFEARLTFAGTPTGTEVRSVSPTPESISLRQHHSFVRLPDDGYTPRRFDPRCGYFSYSFSDYAQPIDQPLQQRYITRHRLEKSDPSAEKSTPVEPIVYYLDPGTPEPIRTALLEGARWWDEAFEAAGYIRAFRVKILPPDADPMDVRYNLINWVHRSTRGWSYGSSVIDPRTGEIIKGHVLLGSLRVRQDFLLAQGVIEGYSNGEQADPRLLEMALARLRQLSAHEVGHTLGLSHNFAASVNGRASVMDYPHPFIQLLADERISLEDAYDTGIGAWDKRAILYGYADLREQDEANTLDQILEENDAMGLHYLTDQDARPLGSAHPLAHLWDNGEDATTELNRLSTLRQTTLNRLGLNNLAPGHPLAELERILVPVYFMHRYQVEATSKLIAGYNYEYSVRSTTQNSSRANVEPIGLERQQEAAQALLHTISPEFLSIPQSLIRQIPPQPPGFSRDRELFRFYSGAIFDPLAAAETASDLVLRALLNPERLARLEVQYATSGGSLWNSGQFLGFLYDQIDGYLNESVDNPQQTVMAQLVFFRFFQHLLALASNENLQPRVKAEVLSRLEAIHQDLPGDAPFQLLLSETLRKFKAGTVDFEIIESFPPPDGSPIGCGGFH